ncbi:MAG: hypothetical protein CML29_08480 [Rhizobiales bacterium]|nr:hypothetical protein [Hyphomicrobiales bacterium]MBA68925.1 hypothetical protein [Hyphomicrobiales bacterium]
MGNNLHAVLKKMACSIIARQQFNRRPTQDTTLQSTRVLIFKNDARSGDRLPGYVRSVGTDRPATVFAPFCRRGMVPLWT